MGRDVKPIHIGKCIKEQVESEGLTTVWLADQLGYHRTNLYKIYEMQTIDTGVLFRISKILKYDFFKLYTVEFEADCSQSVYM